MKNILVIRFSSLGDIVLTEPVVRALSSYYPDTTISFLTKQQHLPLLSMFAHVHRRYGWEDDRQGVELLATLQEQRFDLIVDLHNNLRSARVRAALPARALRTRKEWFKRIASVKLGSIGGKPSHAVERYFHALDDLGITSERLAPELVFPEESYHWWLKYREHYSLPHDYYVIAAGATHATKQVPDELWVKLQRALADRGSTNLVLVGSPAERDYLSRLASILVPTPAMILTEESVCSAAAALKGAKFVVSNDSGLTHLAAAIGTPVVALFGPTHPVLGFAPMGKHADHYTTNEYCSPCSLHGDRKCFREQRFCFTGMDIAAIVAKIERLVQS